MKNPSLAQTMQFLEDLEAGRTRTTFDAHLDAMYALTPNDDRWNQVRRVNNPKRMGLCDKYIASF